MYKLFHLARIGVEIGKFASLPRLYNMSSKSDRLFRIKRVNIIFTTEKRNVYLKENLGSVKKCQSKTCRAKYGSALSIHALCIIQDVGHHTGRRASYRT